MRIILFNPYEFESASSEQMLGVAYAPTSEHTCDSAFLSEIGRSTKDFSFPASKAEHNKPTDQNRIERELLSYIKLATGRSFDHQEITRIQIISDDWNDKSAIFEIDGTRFWCNWFTTA